MRSRIQVKHVTELVKCLEEHMQLIEPVIGVLQRAVEKSKIWIEDKNDNPSITYIELYQELESATTAMLDAASHIISENIEPVDVEVAKPSFSQSAPKTAATEKRDRTESKYQVKKQAQQTDEIVSRLEQIETAISSLQDANIKSTDDISEIKQWRDNFVTEQSDMGVNIEQLIKKQKQNFKNLRKQMSEQDNKIKELNKEIESLKEKESKSNKTLEKLSLDMKQYENNLQKINKKMQFYTDNTDGITKEMKRHSDLIVSLQEESDASSIKLEKVQSKHSVMYKLLLNRLMHIDKLIKIFNQNLEIRAKNIKKLGSLEKDVLNLTGDFEKFESRVFNKYACYIELADPTPVRIKTIISNFEEVHEYNGKHFNPTTGKFVSPHDGLYLVCVSLHENENKLIGVVVKAGFRVCRFIEVKRANTSTAGSVVVDMKKGQELYFQVFNAEQGATLSGYSSFTIVSL